MSRGAALELSLLPGARELLAVHAAELPQRDDLCGAFCGALSLRAAGISQHAGEILDQDAVAVAAGSVIAAARAPGVLPHGESGRRDYRLTIPTIEDEDLSGTTVAGLLGALEQLGAGAIGVLPYSGPWTDATLGVLFDAATALKGPVTLIANLATHHLWGSHPSAAQLLDELLAGSAEGPAPDWRVGHFACVVGRVSGPRGCLYVLADTYRSLGWGGVHVQPSERLCAALERSDMPAGGMLVVAGASEVQQLRAAARAAGLAEGVWDNGTASAEAA
jgi:hypothetical protein